MKHDQVGKLHFHLANKGNFAESIVLIGITIPSTLFAREMNDYRTYLSSTAAVKCLRRAFRLPHSTLSLGVSITPEDTAWTVVRLLRMLLRNLFMITDGAPAFGKTKRLVFQFWFPHGEPTHTVSKIRSSMTSALECVEFERCKRRWVAKKPEEGGRVLWLFGFDAEDGLPEVDAVHHTYEAETGARIPELPRVPTPLTSPLASSTPSLLSRPLAGEFAIRSEGVLRVLPAELESIEVTPPPSQGPIARAPQEAQKAID
jgi:hypothetical protein